MKRVVMCVILLLLLTIPAAATEIEAPEVPEFAEQWMPQSSKTLGGDLLQVLRQAAGRLMPELREAVKICCGVFAAVMCLSVVQSFPGSAQNTMELAGTVAVGTMLLGTSNAMIKLGMETVRELSEYGKLLLPVMTTALAAQGGVTKAAALYAGTAFFTALLSTLIANMIGPLLYLFLALAAANSAAGEILLQKLRDFLKWLIIWSLKIILYIFTGYMAITGVVSGTTDASTLRAAKLTISGAVPVVGSILSDASEAVLVSMSTMKNAAGIYGFFAILAIAIGPFLKIGSHYLVLKITGGVSSLFAGTRISGFIGDFSTAMGIVLGMTGAVSFMQVISTFCFLKGVG